MINSIIFFSIKNKGLIWIITLAIIIAGVYSMTKIPLDAVPDITNNQVQVITTTPNLGTSDIEQFVTYPVELSMSNLPGVIELRSVSRFGLSVVTIVFEDDMGTYLPRQLVQEKLSEVSGQIPDGFGEPFMAPISTGLGEIYQYTIIPKPGYDTVYSAMELRTIQDWIVRRQMSMLPGVVEVNSFGGYQKQYEVAVDPDKMKSMDIGIMEIFNALENNNENTGGAYIEKDKMANFIRGEGLLRNIKDIEDIVITVVEGNPILIRDVATVKFGNAVRYGAFTKDGKGEAVGGIVMMLKGENSNQVIERVKERIAEIQKTLPEGLEIEPFLNRSEMIKSTTGTVAENLVLGALIVVFFMMLLLGGVRGGLIIASVMPLSLLFAFSLMYIFDVWANLMSLGAIDFGIIIDGAVIIVESVMIMVAQHFDTNSTGAISDKKMAEITYNASTQRANSVFFGLLIILIIFFPILALTGIEGKMFKPMALTTSFALIGGLILSLTYVPAISVVLLKGKPKTKKGLSDKIMDGLNGVYEPVLLYFLKASKSVIIMVVVLLAVSIFAFTKIGGEFIPKLDEGDIAFQALLKPGTSLTEVQETSTKLQKIVLDNFPEVEQIVGRMGVAEIPTDPMPMDIIDMFVILKPKDQWVSAKTKNELIEKMKKKISVLPGINFEFTQPIEMRFNELLTGVREDVSVKLYGEDLDVLAVKVQEMAKIIGTVKGTADLRVEATKGLQQMTVQYNRAKIAEYGLNIKDLNTIVRSAFSGESAGVIFEGEKRFDLVVRLEKKHKKDIESIRNLYVHLPSGNQIPLKEVAEIDYKGGPMQISRDGTKRRIYVGINVRGRDVESTVKEIQQKLDAQLKLPPGYYIKYGGAFENLERAKNRLIVVVPLALALIFVLLFLALRSIKQTTLIFMAIPMAAIGGIFSLYFRDINFSISAGVGFIILFGVSVMNGLVLINQFNALKEKGVNDLTERISRGAKEVMRPILLAASTDIVGFVPMALSQSAGAEVQRPLATVVIGGLLTSLVLSLLVIPVLYYLFESPSSSPKKTIVTRLKKKIMNKKIIVTLILSSLLMVACGPGNENHEEEHHEDTRNNNIVALSIRQMKAIKLELGRVEKRNLSTTVKSNGRTKLPPQSKANVSTLVGGVVKNVFVIEGNYVKKGQILATIEHPDIVDMQQQYLENVNSLEFLEQDFRRKEKLFKENVGSGKDYQKALSEYNTAKSTATGLKAKLQMLGISISKLERGNISSRINIVSPISGYVRFVEVNIGSFVEPNRDMFEIVDNRKIHVDILVYEKDIYKIKNGLRVHFTLSNVPGKELKGNIFSVGRAYENEARAITVHANIENTDGNIIPGMYVNAHILVDTLTTKTLPEEALVTEGDRYFIFVKAKGKKSSDTEKEHSEGEKWYFEKTEVVPGIRDNGFVEIKLLAPLPENAEIAINVAYYLLAEMSKGENEE